jgi:NAD(P)H-nitrite reductase large subunit
VGSIEVVDLAPRILSSVLDDESAAIVMSRIADKIKFRLNVSADRFEIGKAYFSDGTTTQFDVLVIAVGVRPNTLLLANCGGTLRRGIVVDDKQQTDIKDIYAAGDVCESYDTSSDQNKILAILPNAYAQGRVAGINMAGGNIAINDAIPLNALGLFGTHIVTAGSYSGNEIKSDKRGYKKLFMKDGTLKGYIIIDEIDKAGIYTALIRNRTPLSDEDIELIRVSPSLAAFSDAYRVQILSGASR